MDESGKWKGKPSQLLNLGIFLSSFFVITIPFAFVRWKTLSNTTYEITSTEASVKSTFIDKIEESVEINKIKELLIERPLFLKLFSLSNLVITTENPAETIVFAGVRDVDNLKNKLTMAMNNFKN